MPKIMVIFFRFARNQKEKKMARRNLFIGVLCAMMLILFYSGCATNVASAKTPEWDKKPIPIEGRDYTILGNVMLKKNWFGILGFSVTQYGIDAYLYQSGGVTYADLLTEAKGLFPTADAVIDVTIDYSGSVYGIFYAQRQNIVTGLAVEYVKNPSTDPTPSINVRLR